MKIEIGKTYANRLGDKVENIHNNDKTSVFGFVGTVYGSKHAYREDGSWALMSGSESGHDLVAEWREPVRIEHGKLYVRHDGVLTGPAVVEDGIPDIAHFPCSNNHVYVATGCGNFNRAEDINRIPRLQRGTDIAAEYVFKVEVGKFYRTAGGKIEGPMKLGRGGDCYLSENPNTIQVYGDGQIWNEDGSVCVPCHGEEMHHLVEEVVEPIPVLVEAGKFYMTKGGVVVGPMIEEGYLNWLQCSNGSIRQHVCPSASQVWLPNGQVAEKTPFGEDLHEITHEVQAPVAAEPPSDEGFVSEIERLKVVISGLQGKLDRVQNIHAHTIKTVRKARRDVKKVNKALSDEQQRRTSLERRLAEVVRAATEAADYAKAIHKTAPKAKPKGGIAGETRVRSEAALKMLREGDISAKNIDDAFAWSTSPQGHQYWWDRQEDRTLISAQDRAFFKALLDKTTGE